MNTQEKMKVMHAWLAGKPIEYRYQTPDGYSEWMEVGGEPAWNWQSCEYRIKPKPIYKPYYSAYELLKDTINHDFTCISIASSLVYRVVH